MTGIPNQSGRQTGPQIDKTDSRFSGKVETVRDADFNRRGFLKAGLCCATVATCLSPTMSYADNDELKFQQLNDGAENRLWGVALAYGEDKLDLIDLDNNKLLHSFSGLRATHAITPIEHLNRFIVHGSKIGTREGAIGVLQVDPVKKTWSIPFYKTLTGGPALHWQPDPEFKRVVFNTIGDGGLHVLDTNKLTLRSYTGGGGHSNMAFLDQYLIATDEMSGPTNVRVINLETGKIESKTPVGNWGHGLTVCRERGEAFVWSREGVQVVSLAKKTLGKHSGIFEPKDVDVRGWFCWTPQGGQFSHDVAWAYGDKYRPHLLVTDMKNHRLEKIPTGDPDLQPSFLQLSPDGKWGMASLRGREEIGIFDTAANTFNGVVKAGPARPGFFERDMTFCLNRDCGIVTNTGDNSISLLDLKRKEEVRRISLPRRPMWLKAISPTV